MKWSLMILGMLMLKGGFIVQAQEKSYRQLHVGDTVPEVMLENMRNYNGTSTKLSDFKGKAIILDFWGSGCTNCIAALPKMAQLQLEFKDDLQIILVTEQPLSDFELLFKNSPLVKDCKLPMVFANKELSNRMFPHTSVPYHAWIDKAGVVRALNNGIDATSENIKDLIEGRKLKIDLNEELVEGDAIKHDESVLSYNNGILLKYLVYYNNKVEKDKMSFHTHLNILKANSIIDPEYPYYSLIMRDPVFSLGNLTKTGSGTRTNSKGEVIGMRVESNMMELYSIAYNAQGLKIIIENEPHKYYLSNSERSAKDIQDWWKQNSFVYEIQLPKWDNEIYKNTLKNDLESYFGLVGKVELRKINCIVLKRNDQQLKLETKGGPSIYEDTKSEKGLVMQNIPLEFINAYLTAFFSNYRLSDPVFINETGFNKAIDMVIHSPRNDIRALNNEFMKYGLSIKEEVRELPALVLRKVNNN